MNVTDTGAHPALVKQTLDRFGQVDVLVNNAGRAQRARWELIELDVDRQLFDLIVYGITSLTCALLPTFLTKKRGHVVTLSSLAGKMVYMESLRWEKSMIDVT